MNTQEAYWAIVQLLNPDIKMSAGNMRRDLNCTWGALNAAIAKLANDGFIVNYMGRWYLTPEGREFHLVRSTL